MNIKDVKQNRKLSIVVLFSLVVLMPMVTEVNAIKIVTYKRYIDWKDDWIAGTQVGHGDSDQSSFITVAVKKSGDTILSARIKRIVLDWYCVNNRWFPPTVTLYYFHTYLTLNVGSNSEEYDPYVHSSTPILNPWWKWDDLDDYREIDWVDYGGSGGVSVEIKSIAKQYTYLVGYQYPQVTTTKNIIN